MPGLFKRILGLGGRAAAAAAPAAAPGGPLAERRWEAAETNRLNKAHWQKARGQPVNADLYVDLPQLRARAAHEVKNNPVLEGVLGTYCNDVVGRNGPAFQVQSDDAAYNAALEAVWRDWWKCPDVRGICGGVDLMRLWCRGLWTNGEFLAQKVTAAAAPGGPPPPVALRLKAVHPRRLYTPAALAGDPAVVMGVRQTAEGQPLEYMISDPRVFGAFVLDEARYTPVSARSVVHRFLVVEEDQARGVPWLAPSLPSTADLRDFDAQVLDAARAAADQAVFLYTDHPDANFLDVNESSDVERRTMSTCPPGWKPSMLNPTQPGPNYLEYRRERQSDLGRPVGMPLMMVRLDSSEHSYSSARFDAEVYLRGLQAVQGWLERRTLNDLVAEVEAEARLYAAANPRWEHAAALRRPRPAGLDLRWTWSRPPQVDRMKEATAQDLKLRNGTLAYSDALAEEGKDLETVIAARRRDIKALADAGLPPLPTPLPAPLEVVDEPDAGGGKTGDNKNTKNKPAPAGNKP